MLKKTGLIRTWSAIGVVVTAGCITLWITAKVYAGGGSMQTFTVQLNGGKPGWEVYELIVLGEGGNGKDHWGWGGGTGVFSADGNRQLKRDDPSSWLPIHANSTFTFSIPSARSREIAGVARIIKRKTPGSNEGIHGSASFYATWPGA